MPQGAHIGRSDFFDVCVSYCPLFGPYHLSVQVFSISDIIIVDFKKIK